MIKLIQCVILLGMLVLFYYLGRRSKKKELINLLNKVDKLFYEEEEKEKDN